MEYFNWVTKEALVVVGSLLGGVLWLARLESKVHQNTRDIEYIADKMQEGFKSLESRMDKQDTNINDKLHIISEDIKNILRGK